jgi:hypothetical protein
MKSPVSEGKIQGDNRPCTPGGHIHLHAVIPVEAHTRARIAALKSGLSFRSYLAKLLMSAEPLDSQVDAARAEPGHDVPDGSGRG